MEINWWREYLESTLGFSIGVLGAGLGFWGILLVSSFGFELNVFWTLFSPPLINLLIGRPFQLWSTGILWVMHKFSNHFSHFIFVIAVKAWYYVSISYYFLNNCQVINVISSRTKINVRISYFIALNTPILLLFRFGLATILLMFQKQLICVFSFEDFDTGFAKWS